MVAQSQRIETQHVDQWVDAIWSTYGSLAVVLDRTDAFSGAMTRHDLGPLKAVEVRAMPQEFRRTEHMIRRDAFDDLILCMVAEGQAVLVQDGRSCVLGRGAFAFVESSRPYSMLVNQPGRVLDFAWSREAIGLSESESREATARAFSAESPLGGWLSPLLSGLLETAHGISESGTSRVVNGVGSLLVAAVLEAGQPSETDERSRRRYEDMIRYIERNLDDLDLGADSLARAFFVSPRTVNRLFASFGKPVAATIRDRRLEECSRMMVSSAFRDKSIGFIASQFGFTSASVFSRAFTAKYGVAPTSYRRDAS